MDTFTIVTGVASLIGLAIQLFDLLPKFAHLRKPSFFLFFGIFIGSFLHAFDASSIKIAFQFTLFTTFLTVTATILIAFLIAAAFTSEANQKKEFYWIVKNSFFILFFVFMMEGTTTMFGNQNDQLSISELSNLSELALQNKDFERAVMYLKTIESRNINSAQMKIMQVKIQQIESQELK